MNLSEKTSYNLETGQLTVASHNGVPITVTLTPKQNDLFKLLLETASKEDKVVTRQMSDALWGALPSNVYGCRRTIDVYINQLRQILKYDEEVNIITLSRKGHYIEYPFDVPLLISKSEGHG